jgi:hypothetical protein
MELVRWLARAKIGVRNREGKVVKFTCCERGIERAAVE